MAARNVIRTVLGALRGDPEDRYVFAERFARRISPEALLSERARLWILDGSFRREYEQVEPQNLRRMDRLFMLDQLAGLAATLPGNTAECGAYQGASSYFVCRRLRAVNKIHHVFDSFEGLSAPSVIDGNYWRGGDLTAPEAIARRNLEEFDFVHFHKGWIPDRFDDIAHESFALVHIDVDLHDPTLASLDFFYPRLVPGAMLVLDDYGFATCPGVRAAVRTYFESRPETVLELPTGQGLVFKK
jgi:hypothetical protein